MKIRIFSLLGMATVLAGLLGYGPNWP